VDKPAAFMDMTVNSSIRHAVTTEKVAGAIQFRNVFVDLGGHVHKRERRAACLLCAGRSKWTLSYTAEGLWHCHRCHAGGDVFTLVELANGISFKHALGYLATTAGIDVGLFDSDELDRHIKEQREQRERQRCEEEQRRVEERRKRIAERDFFYLLEQRYEPASQRLSELCHQNSEAELHWAALSALLATVRQAQAEYYRLAGLGVAR
jgi:hypothetical protein